MSADRSTQTQQAGRPVSSRPSVRTLQQEIRILRKQVLMLRAELDEAGEVERFLRTRLRDLNANIRVDRAHLAELEGAGCVATGPRGPLSVVSSPPGP